MSVYRHAKEYRTTVQFIIRQYKMIAWKCCALGLPHNLSALMVLANTGRLLQFDETHA